MESHKNEVFIFEIFQLLSKGLGRMKTLYKTPLVLMCHFARTSSLSEWKINVTIWMCSSGVEASDQFCVLSYMLQAGFPCGRAATVHSHLHHPLCHCLLMCIGPKHSWIKRGQMLNYSHRDDEVWADAIMKSASLTAWLALGLLKLYTLWLK